MNFLDTFNLFNLTFSRNYQIFNKIPTNFNGRILKAAVIDYPPYCVIDRNNPNKGSVTELNSSTAKKLDLYGTEGLLITEFMRKYNFSMEIKVSDKWGILFKNGTGTELLGSVVRYEIDFAMASLYINSPENMYYAFSAPIRRSRITGLVPKPR